MHSPQPTIQSTKVSKLSSNTPRLEKISKIILISAFSIDLIILPALFIKLFINPKQTTFAARTSYVTSPTLGTDTGLATESLLTKLEGNNLKPVVVKTINRLPFTVNGKMITLGGDNFEVFEYANHDMASADAAPLIAKYATSTRSPINKYNIHIYVDDTLVIFYKGDQKAILASFNSSEAASISKSTTEPLVLIPSVTKSNIP